MQSSVRFAARLAVAYLILLAVSAWLGQWDAEFLKGRDLWHFTITRMGVPMLALAVLAAFARTIASALMLAALLLFVGAISAIKKEATGEPFQISDLFLAEQSTHLLSYVSWQKWLMGIWVLPAAVYYFRNLRLRRESLPIAIICIALLSTYRIEAVAKFIHDYAGPYGLENLTFSQAESERMNGLATHLYFSTAGLWLSQHEPQEMEAAMARLDVPAAAPAKAEVQPDVFIVLGEAWWRDPSDTASPLDQLEAAGVAEGNAISPVYGGTTPNSEFEALTAVPIKSFRSGIIPYQHYSGYFTANTITMARLLKAQGYSAHAYHNFTPRFWLRDKVYPRFGFDSYDSAKEMNLEVIPDTKDQWPSDHALYDKVLERAAGGGGPQFHYIVTVSTHGPYKPGPDCGIPGKFGACDYRNRLDLAAQEFAQFVLALQKRGRPFVLAAFGDHLPGLREHQEAMGMKGMADPRMHEVPLLIASSAGAAALRDKLTAKPLYCLSPMLAEVAGLGIDDRYFRHMAQACANGTAGVPEEAVIQHQLFN